MKPNLFRLVVLWPTLAAAQTIEDIPTAAPTPPPQRTTPRPATTEEPQIPSPVPVATATPSPSTTLAPVPMTTESPQSQQSPSNLAPTPPPAVVPSSAPVHSHTETLYPVGGFPAGSYYTPQELAKISVRHPHNAWLVGTFRIIDKGDHSVTLQSGGASKSTGVGGLDLLAGLVNKAAASHVVTVDVTIIQEQAHSFPVGALGKYDKSYPLKIESVSVSGNSIKVDAIDLCDHSR